MMPDRPRRTPAAGLTGPRSRRSPDRTRPGRRDSRYRRCTRRRRIRPAPGRPARLRSAARPRTPTAGCTAPDCRNRPAPPAGRTHRCRCSGRRSGPGRTRRPPRDAAADSDSHRQGTAAGSGSRPLDREAGSGSRPLDTEAGSGSRYRERTADSGNRHRGTAVLTRVIAPPIGRLARVVATGNRRQARILTARERRLTRVIAPPIGRLTRILTTGNRRLARILTARERRLTRVIAPPIGRLTRILTTGNRRLTRILTARERRLTRIIATRIRRLTRILTARERRLTRVIAARGVRPRAGEAVRTVRIGPAIRVLLAGPVPVAVIPQPVRVAAGAGVPRVPGLLADAPGAATGLGAIVVRISAGPPSARRFLPAAEVVTAHCLRLPHSQPAHQPAVRLPVRRRARPAGTVQRRPCRRPGGDHGNRSPPC